MKNKSFKSSMEDFFSYVMLFGFLGIVGLGGWWWYQHRPAPASTADEPATQVTAVEAIAAVTATTPPSTLLKPVMEASLPPLLGPLQKEPLQPSPAFISMESLVAQKVTERGDWQPAWLAARKLCEDIRSLYKERTKFTAKYTGETDELKEGKNGAKFSAGDLKARADRAQFFQRATEASWQGVVAPRKKHIEALYRELLTVESGIAH